MKQLQEVPVLYTRKEECCGCSACYAVCPVGAIEMQADEEGFLYPHIDLQKCLKCRSCMKVCPLKASYGLKSE